MKTALLALALFALPALAQDSAAAPKTAGEFAVSMLPLLFGLLSTLITALVVPALRAWILEKAKTSKLAAVAMKVEHLSELAVAHLNAGMKADFAAAAADGKITPDEARQLKDKAIALIKEFLGEQGLDSITGVFGLGSGLVETYLSGAIEKAVASAPGPTAAGTAARAPDAAPASPQ